MKRKRFNPAAICSVSPTDDTLYHKSREQHYLFMLKETHGNEDLVKAICTGEVRVTNTTSAVLVKTEQEVTLSGRFKYYTKVFGKEILLMPDEIDKALKAGMKVYRVR